MRCRPIGRRWIAEQPMLRKAILTLFASSILTLAVLGMPAAAATLHGSRFMEALKDNTVSGKTASGMPYNLYFIEGGQVTYRDARDRHDSGTWHFNENGDVCLRWRNSAAPIDGCFRVTIDGRSMILAKGASKVHFVLRGTVALRVL
jgi:hypothetical protein